MVPVGLAETSERLLACVGDALAAALRPVCSSYQTVGTPVILTCCDCPETEEEANGELSIHFRRLFDADPQSLVEVQRVRPCRGGITAAQFRLVIARCFPTVNEKGEVPDTATQEEAALDLQQDTELMWQALACCTGLDLRIDDLSVDLGPRGGCSIVFADVTVQVLVPAIAPSVPTDTTPPSVPTGLAASDITQISFTLSWNASTGSPSLYEVFRNGVSQGTTSSLSMPITGLSAGVTYSMRVRARDAAGNWSAQSTILSVATEEEPDTPALKHYTFEAGVEGFSSWFASTVTQTTSDAHDSTGSLSYEQTAQFSGVQRLTPFAALADGLVPGEDFKFELWYKEAVGTAPAVVWSIKWTDGASFVGDTEQIVLPRETSWTHAEQVVTMPVDAVNCFVDLSTNSGSTSTILFDDMTVTPA